MKTVLVTGGAGYIGSHAVVELTTAGYRPIIIDNFSNSNERVIGQIESIVGSKIPTYKGNFQDKKLINKIFSAEKVVGVIHFAAHKSVAESVKQPLEYYENNVAGLISLLEVMELTDIDNLVFSSSCTVYGEADKFPITEDSPMKPATSPYGTTKQICETIIKDTTQASKKLKAMSLRYFNPIGAHASALIGELPHGTPANLVPFITEVAAGIRKELTVFGNDYPTPDGTNIRDYIHVVDLAHAHVKAVGFLLKQKPAFYDVVNIGTGRGSSVMEVIRSFEKTTGVKVPYRIGPRRPGDAVSYFASATKAKEVINWQSGHTLAQSLKDAWLWQETLKKKS
ncbi:UDP-glucose 4-epimerase GalE [Candidatus Saccharibacteria bacterium RIFCSPHIGHO2_12_FULL_47_16b]|nr:MAG: UDP-glucose 4-epimerase GalE [Candidatus Saccharibacteria bacterium RIFCSPHIGHO2_12_FULL_47_16b]